MNADKHGGYLLFRQTRDESDYLPHFVGTDSDVAADAKCDICGGPVHYQGFKNGDSYRAFIVCEKCKWAAEF